MAAAMKITDLTAKLFVEGCLASVAGTVQGTMPIAPKTVSELERTELGLAQGGSTLFYPLPPAGVFLDMTGPVAAVFFSGADAERALDVVEKAMKNAYPNTKQLKDETSETDKTRRKRSYQVDFGNSRLGLVEIIYPQRGGRPFTARVTAQARKN